MRLVATFAVVLLASACDLAPRVTSNAASDAWTQTQPRLRERLATLRQRHNVLAGRIGALRVPDGIQDPALQATIADLQGAIADAEPALAGAEANLAQASVDIERALTNPNKVEARRVVDISLARLEPAITGAASALDGIEPRVAQAEAMMQRGLAAVEAEQQRLRRIAFDGGRADLTDIAFAPDDSLDVTTPASNAALVRLRTFASTCDGLRFTINGHTARGDAAAQQARSQARADAVKAYLVGQGIAADKIARTAGLGATQPVVEEPAPDSAAARQLAPEELASRRRRNERIEVVVTTACPPPTAKPTAEAPHGHAH